MKHAKVLMILFLAAALIGGIVITANEVMAKVGENVAAVCSVCHTMHHSQNGTDPNLGFGDGRQSTGPNPALLYATNSNNNDTCVACHTMADTSHATKGYDLETGAPQVDLEGDDILAGGTYAYHSSGGDTYVHNVLGITGADGTIPNDEEGLNEGDIPPGGANTDIGDALQITCAGTTGCHGNRALTDNVAAVHGAHHTNDDSFCTGSSLGNSYRFLTTNEAYDAFNDDPVTGSGVDGGEESWWEGGKKDLDSTIMAENATEHNVYDAADINLVCASCHGDFHGYGNEGELPPSGTDGQDGEDEGPDDPWLRHPTDVTLDEASTSGPSEEYDDYPNDAVPPTKNYSLEAPVGYAQNELTNTVTKLQGRVLCISCHRAHGSQWPDILRWCYSTMTATGGTGIVDSGCNTCHTTK